MPMPVIACIDQKAWEGNSKGVFNKSLHKEGIIGGLRLAGIRDVYLETETLSEEEKQRFFDSNITVHATKTPLLEIIPKHTQQIVFVTNNPSEWQTKFSAKKIMDNRFKPMIHFVGSSISENKEGINHREKVYTMQCKYQQLIYQSLDGTTRELLIRNKLEALNIMFNKLESIYFALVPKLITRHGKELRRLLDKYKKFYNDPAASTEFKLNALKHLLEDKLQKKLAAGNFLGRFSPSASIIEELNNQPQKDHYIRLVGLLLGYYYKEIPIKPEDGAARYLFNKVAEIQIPDDPHYNLFRLPSETSLLNTRGLEP